MTKRRSIIALFLAVAILALGVGYAALTDTLTAGGTVGTPAFDSLVMFDQEFTETASGTRNGATGVDFLALTGTGVTATTITYSDADTAVVTVGEGNLIAKDDYMVVTLKIKNTSTLDAVISNATPTVTGDTDNFSVSDVTIATPNVDALAGATEVSFKITLTNVPTTDASASFTVTFTATSK